MALPKNFQPKKEGSRYTMSKLNSGETVKIRILSDFISGNMTWSGHTKDDKKPVRVPENTPMLTTNIGTNLRSGEPERIKQFIAAIVWNYDNEVLEIFETDKATIISRIYEFETDPDYGDSKAYDLKVSKKGTGMETEYSVMPSPPTKVSKDIATAYGSEQINLKALYSGADPFTPQSDGNEASDEGDTEPPTEQDASGEKIADEIPF